MKIRSSLLITVLCFVSQLLPAQGIQYKYDTKVIYTDSLQMPRNTLAYTLLLTLPEMLQRPGESLLSNYDVQIDDISVGNASDVALNQLMIADIEKIEITESPVASYLKNGVGGAIKIFLRSKTENQRTTWGSMGVSTYYPADLGPQFLLNHNSGKFSLKTLVMADIYRNTWSEDQVTKDSYGELLSREHSDNDYRYRTQLCNVYLSYRPTNRDELKLNLSETSYHLNTMVTPEYDESQEQSNKKKMFSIDAILKYIHQFNNAQLETELQMGHSPRKQESFFGGFQALNKQTSQNHLSGKVLLKGGLQPSGINATMNWEVGTAFNYVKADDEILNRMMAGANKNEAVNNTHFIQPYTELSMQTGKLKMKFIGELQHFCYELERQEEDLDISRNDFTGMFITEWHFNNNQALRFLLNRKLNRPSENQLFPLLLFNQESLCYTKGNPNLLPFLSHEISLDFISNHHMGDHAFTYNARLSYNIQNDLISSFSATDDGIPSYITYKNDGNSKILNANLMAMYRYKQFMVSVTANGYHKKQTLGGEESKYNYFNLSVLPQFNLAEGWHGAVQVSYFSKVKLQSGTLSDCCLAQMTVGKQWRNIFVYFYDRVTMHKQAHDKSTAPDRNTTTFYEMVPNSLGLGVKYSF